MQYLDAISKRTEYSLFISKNSNRFNQNKTKQNKTKQNKTKKKQNKTDFNISKK